MENSQVNNDHNEESQKSSEATEVKKSFINNCKQLNLLYF